MRWCHNFQTHHSKEWNPIGILRVFPIGGRCISPESKKAINSIFTTMKSENYRLTFEEQLASTNEELTSNWTKLASFIQSYEGISYVEAGVKARALLGAKTAVDYIEAVRIAAIEGAEIKLPTEKKRATLPKKLANEKTIYEKNYDRLLAIAPDLEERLTAAISKDGYLYGKSVRTGYMDFNIELLHHDNSGFYLAISHYYLQNGDMVPDPDMEILLDMDYRTIQALHFQDTYRYVEVYDDKYDRKLVNTQEKRAQNDFLGKWLKNLKSQGHQITWKERDSTGVLKSSVVDEYKKGEQKKSEPKLEKLPDPEPPNSEKEPELAKIISLASQPTEEQTKEVLDAFIRIVRITDGLTGLKIVYKVKEILENEGTSQYLLSAWEKMKQSDFKHLSELNYMRLHALIPDFLDTLRQEKGLIRLVSEKSKTVFRMQMGDDRKANECIIGIVQQKGVSPEPSLLIRVQTDTRTVRTELSTDGFAGSVDYYPDKKDEHSDGPYETALAFERWLKYLELKKFKPVLVHMKKVVDVAPAAEPQPIAQEPVQALELPHEEHSINYINKDIPDFEPGHVKLTEVHKKRGITQKVINHINRTKEGVTLYPRSKKMIPMTKSVSADAKRQAKQPGFRLSATGKFYYEGRSNRADRTTDQGL